VGCALRSHQELSRELAFRADGLAPGRTQESLDALVLRIHKAGLQSCIHSNGDREIDMVLNAYEAALKAEPRQNHRHRIEHCSVVNEKILKRIKALDLVIAPHSYIYEHGDKLKNFGEARWDWMIPNRSLIEQGTVVAGNSDYPVSAAIPLLRTHDMVNRTSAEGKTVGAKQRRLRLFGVSGFVGVGAGGSKSLPQQSRAWRVFSHPRAEKRVFLPQV
jgi:predicted amidohydrolase YtcJ